MLSKAAAEAGRVQVRRAVERVAVATAARAPSIGPRRQSGQMGLEQPQGNSPEQDRRFVEQSAPNHVKWSSPYSTVSHTALEVGEVASKSGVDFNSTEAAFRNKSLLELLRSYAVLRICGFPIVVENSDALIKLSQKVLGKTVSNFLIRKSFFAQFCGAEDEAGLRPVMRRLEAAGIQGILDYAVEADLDTNREERENEIKVRVYDYEGERQCDEAAKVFESCIRTAHAVSLEKGTGSRPFAAIKVTALGKPDLLKRMSEMILQTRRLFQRMEESFDRESQGSLTLSEWRAAYDQFFTGSEDEVDALFWYALGKEPTDFDPAGPEPTLDIVDWVRSMDIDVISRLILSCKSKGPLAKVALSPEELDLAHALFARLQRLAALASELGVSLMIDAEQTYFQPCIDANVLMLQREYNRDGRTTIFGTYQCYLKSTDDRLAQDLDRSKREGWRFAAKLVRGAYMVAERKLAAKEGYPDPIHDTLEDTHACYHRNLDTMLQDENAEVMVASHNQQTCEFAVARMKEYGIANSGNGVHFGQLLGMADHLTFALGAHGYSAYKYLPYGAVDEVLPYLVRRAQENSGLMAGAVHERGLLLSEIKRRILPAVI